MGKLRRSVLKMNQKLTVQYAAALLAGSTLMSILLGFYRDRLLNGMYYESYRVGIDAYTAAFTVPDFMFMILVSGALSVTFIPVFNQRIAAKNKVSAWQLSSSMINLMALITLVASVLIIIFADPILRYIIAPGLSESGMALATSMMRVIAVNPFLFAIAAVISSIQQAVGRFAFYALAPTLYNVGIIIGAKFFTGGITIFGYEIFDGGIMGVALGVVLGSILQLLVSLIGLAGLGFDYEMKIFWRNHGFKKVLSLLPARSIDQGMDYLVSLVETNLTSRMTEGAIRAFQQASTLHMAPINLIGVAISTAAYPRLTERVNAEDTHGFKDEFRTVLRVIIWLALPVAVIAFAARGYVVGFINPGGDQLMANILGVFTVAILFRAIYHIAARGFYAQQDTKTPLYISIISISLNIILAVWFTFTLELGAQGLAAAQVIVALIEIILLFYIMNARISGIFDLSFWSAVGRMFLAAVVTGAVAYLMTMALPLGAEDTSLFSALPKFTMITAAGLLAYLAACWVLKIKEVYPVLDRVRVFFYGRR